MHTPTVHRSLPKYTGPHTVGMVDLEVPVEEQVFGDFKRNGQDQAGLLLETVKFSVFYPTDAKKSNTKPLWMPEFSQTVKGYFQFDKKSGSSHLARTWTYTFAWSFFHGATIPALQNAPLADLPQGSEHPVIIFSHGLAGNRFLYSAFCGEMASRGYIVAAIESRDGSGPSTTIKGANGSAKKIEYIQYDQLEWPDGKNDDPMRLRRLQLELRRAEIKELVSIFQRIRSGENGLPLPTRAESFIWSNWRNIVAQPAIIGHSFGGATALSYPDVDTFSKTIVFDPWLDPLKDEEFKAVAPLVIDSEELTVWFPLFDRLRELVKKAGGKLYTIAGASHYSFSDVPILIPNRTNKKMNLFTKAPEVVRQSVDIAVSFLKNNSPSGVNPSSLKEYTRPIAKPGTVLEHDLK